MNKKKKMKKIVKKGQKHPIQAKPQKRTKIIKSS